MTSLRGIINQVRQKAANRKSEFLSYGVELDTELLARQYREVRSKAPERHLEGRKYLFERTGIPSSTKRSNRDEEHLAIALWDKFRKPNAMLLPNGQRLEFLDYQVPLKAVQSDGGVGKVDILGLIDVERIAILELKVKGGDTPLAATLEALVYAAIIEANLKGVGQELQNMGCQQLKSEPPEIIVLGRDDYWHVFNEYDETWLLKLAPVLSDIARTLSITVQFIELETGHLEMGLRGIAPKLHGDVRATVLYSSRKR